MDGKKMIKSVILGGLLLGSCLFGVKVRAAVDEVMGDFLSKDLGLSPGREANIMARIREKCEPNSKLYWAVRSGNLTVVRELLDEKVRDVNEVFPDGEVYHNGTGTDTTTLLETAIRRGNEEIVKLLMEHGADPNQRRLNRFGLYASPLEVAVRFAKPNIVNILLENDADPHQRYSNNNPLLFEAMVNFLPSNKWLKAVRLLLDQGLDPNDKNDHGQVPLTPLVIEIANTTSCWLSCLNYPDRDCAEYAAKNTLQDINYMFEMLELFKIYDANMNAQDNDGNTLLHWGIMPPRGHLNEYRHLNSKLLSILIEFGADVNIKNNDGMTPLDMFALRQEALKNKYDQEAIELLREHGATYSNPSNETESQPQDENAVEDKIEDESGDKNEAEDGEKTEDSKVEDEVEDSES
jgi:ankyrin repeat protein